MAVRFYHILAQNGDVCNYLGKSSDLVFKVEPDKSIDCDDGQTMVGSEKLSCSFSLLSNLVDPHAISKLYLVPNVSGSSTAQIIEINVGTDDYKTEQKSGEFGKTLVNIGIRYPSDVTKPWRYLAESYFTNSVVILGNYSFSMMPIPAVIKVKQGEDWVASTVPEGEIVPRLYCLLNVPAGVESKIYLNDTLLTTVAADEMWGVVWLKLIDK